MCPSPEVVAIISKGKFFNAKGQSFNVEVDNEPIVVSSYNPEHDTCRVLWARGLRGLVRFEWDDGRPGLVMDIDKAAKRTVRETTKQGPRFVKFVEMSDWK